MKNKTKFIIIVSLVLTIFIIQNVSAYTKLCLQDCQGTPANNPRYTCFLGAKNSCGDPGYCEVCVTDAGNPTDPNKCAGQICSSSNDGDIDPNPPVLTVLNPLNNFIYNEKNVEFAVQVDMPSKVEYKDMNNEAKGWQVLCSSCTYVEKSKNFKDGNNSVIVKATKISNDLTDEESVEFAIDSKSPKIHKTYPKKGKYANGEFTVEYSELNLELIKLFYGLEGSMNILDMNFCSNGMKQSCSVTIDLSSFNGQEIGYYFEVIDIASSKVQSKLTNVLVDTTAPSITKFNVTNSGKNVYFDIEIDDETAKIEYMDLDDKNPKFKTLCSKKLVCQKKKSLSEGEHDLVVRAIDKAENSDEEQLNFFI